MKRDVIIGQKLFETCKLSEFYLNLIVNSKYEDESPFQLAKAYTQKLYEIVERYDRLLEANSQRENLSLQLDGHGNSGNSGNSATSRTPSASASASKQPSKSVCSTPVAATTLQSQARTSTPNKCFVTSPAASSLATQLQLQLQMQQTLHSSSQSTPATPCQSTSASSINLAAATHNTSASSSQQQHDRGMRQSSSNYQLGGSNHSRRPTPNIRTASTYKLNSISNSNINSNFYKQNKQRLYSIYYDDYFNSSDDDAEGEADEDDDEVAGYGEDELTVRNDYSVGSHQHNYKTMTISSSKLTKGGGGARAKKSSSRRQSRRDSLGDMDSTILSSHHINQHDVSVRLDDISYDYGEYQHDTQIDLDETSSQHNLLASSRVNSSGVNSAAASHRDAIEKSYSNLSKDSGVLIDSYHSDYSSHHLLNLTSNNSSSLNTTPTNNSARVRGTKAAHEEPVTAAKPSKKAASDKTASVAAARKPNGGGTTSSSASISDNDETNAAVAELENQLLSHSRLNQYIQSQEEDGANETINYADDDDVYDDYDHHHVADDDDFDDDDDNEDDDEDEDEDEDEDDEEPHQYNITDSTHILLKKKAAKRGGSTQASSSLIAKLKSPTTHNKTQESIPLAKLNSQQSPPYNHYAKNPNKYSPIRASKLAFMPNKSSLISSRQSPAAFAAAATNPGQELDFLNKKQLSLIAEKQSDEMDEQQPHFESSSASEQSSFNQQLNLDLDMSMISMMVESDEQRRLRTAQSSPKTHSPAPTAASSSIIDQKVKLLSNKIESMTNRLKNDEPSAHFMDNSYSSSSHSTLSTPSPTSSSASSSSSSSSTGGNPTETTAHNNESAAATTTPSSIPPTPSPYSAASTKSSPQFLFNSISSMNVSMLDNIQATNTSLDFDNMNTSILMFN